MSAAGDGEPLGLRFRQRKAEGDAEEMASLVGAAHVAGLVLHPQLGPVEADRFGERRLGPERCRGEALAVDRRHGGVESLDLVEHRRTVKPCHLGGDDGVESVGVDGEGRGHVSRCRGCPSGR
ncbi:MAG: hypothetical protein EBZ17_09750 [Actinobacteria bacterium]|nr:hypothetical protein [Actinomycetota bacterium]